MCTLREISTSGCVLAKGRLETVKPMSGDVSRGIGPVFLVHCSWLNTGGRGGQSRAAFLEFVPQKAEKKDHSTII